MKNRKQEKAGEKDDHCSHGYIACEMCGRKLIADSCSWLEDDGGALRCEECRAELESCGCSD